MDIKPPVTLEELRQQVAAFVAEREWEQFHAPKNLSMNLVREATELMEYFLWCSESMSYDEVNTKRKEIEEEAADILFALLAFINAANIDLQQAFADKIAKNAQKYPVELTRGKSDKYTAYQQARARKDDEK